MKQELSVAGSRVTPGDGAAAGEFKPPRRRTRIRIPQARRLLSALRDVPEDTPIPTLSVDLKRTCARPVERSSPTGLGLGVSKP